MPTYKIQHPTYKQTYKLTTPDIKQAQQYLLEHFAPKWELVPLTRTHGRITQK